MHRRWMGILTVGLALSLARLSLGQAAKPATFDERQKVEVREGDTWSPATIVKKEGRRFLIRYEGGTEEEWVPTDRIRAGGATAPGNPPPKPAAAPAKVAPDKPAVINWPNGNQVQVKWGGLWFDATIVNRRGEWYLIEYTRQKNREWVEHWRIRKVGDTEDWIGHAQPNARWKPGDNPPREKAGEPPEPLGGGGRKELQKAKEEFTQDPAFKEADLDAGKDLDLRADGGELKLTPDAAAAPGNLRPIKLAGSSREFFEMMKDLTIARGGNFAAVIHKNSAPGQEARLKLERFDLAGGKSTGVFPVTGKTVLLDLSPDGKLVALRNDEFGFGKSNRLEIWALDGTAAKKILILFPNDKESWAPDRDISGAWLLDGASVLSLNPKGRLVLWDIGTGKAIYRAQVAPRAKPAFSAGGKQMAIEAGNFVLIIEPRSGKVLGAIPLEGRNGLTFSFSPSGRQLGGWGLNACAWDLTTGALISEFSISSGGSEFAMVSDGYAMLDHSTLIDFERRIPLWHYQMMGRSAGAVAPSGVLWYSVKGSQEHGPLTPLKVPAAEALALAKTLKPDDLLLLRPGVKVALAMNADVAEADRQAITDSLKNQIQQNKLVLDDTAPIRIIVATEPGKTTEREYRTIGFGAGGAIQKVNVTEMISKVTIEVDGKKAWQTQSVAAAGAFMSLKEGQTIEQAIAEASKPNPTFLRNVKLPAYLTKPRDPAWYGSSRVEAPR